MPVAVEKLASEKSAKIKTRQQALQTIFFDDLDIFYPRISTCFGEKGVFQQPPLYQQLCKRSPRFGLERCESQRTSAMLVDCAHLDSSSLHDFSFLQIRSGS
jgi:hypothetical protein